MKIIFALLMLAVCGPRFTGVPERLQPERLEQVLQSKGAYNQGAKVFKFSFPRRDVEVTVDGTALPPFMGLTTWCAFQPGMRKPAIVAGDIVLFEDEVNAAMSIALDKGLSVTALHTHFFYDKPRVFFMHIGGEGDPVLLADGVRAMLEKVKEIRGKTPKPAKGFHHAPLPAASAINAAALDEIFGATGVSKDGMYKIVFGRQVEMPCGCKIGGEMGVNTWAAFYGSDENALVDGDFICAFGELQPVLQSLRKSDINIVAIHNHMETEAPRMIFLHYWAVGKPVDLARAIKAAIATQPKPTTKPD